MKTQIHAAAMSTRWRTPAMILLMGGLILAIAMGIRHGFGLFLIPMSQDNGWGREVFAFAIALQNLIFGAVQPFTGMLADRLGAGRVIIAGVLLYILGLILMAFAQTSGMLVLSAGVLIGIALSGTTFTVILGAIGRAMPAEKRSMAMGIASAAGSFGQFLMIPGTMSLIGWVGWSTALLLLAGFAVAMLPMAGALFEAPQSRTAVRELSAKQAFVEAIQHPGFLLLSFGFFVCGFQVVFIATHIQPYLLDNGLAPTVGTAVLALIGLFNIGGSWLAGYLGSRLSKPYLLSTIYIGRAIVILLFTQLPLTAFSAYLFAMLMGVLWLSTVPLTNGIVATVFGVRNLSMLTGIVFFFHQIGSFLGGWLGGYLYDRTGNYDTVWTISIGLGVVAALLNLPIRERAVARLQPA